MAKTSRKFMPPPDDEPDDLEIILEDAGSPAASKGKERFVHILMDADIRRQIADFAASDTRRELGGVLIGTLREGDTAEVGITAIIQARFTDASSASLTFTHETWQDILEVKDRDYPDGKIVGWFHTHPSFGIFLSNFDLHIHRNFFNLEWQVAYVVDPLAKTEGFFRWEHGKVSRTEDFIITGVSVPTAVPEAPSLPQAVPATKPAPSAPTRRRRADVRNLVIAGLAVLAAYLLVFPPPWVTSTAPPAPIMTRPTAPAATAPVVKPEPPAPVTPESTVATKPTVPADAHGWPLYTVRAHDSLWSISATWYGDGKLYPLLVTANHLRSPNLRVGMRLAIPGGNTPGTKE